MRSSKVWERVSSWWGRQASPAPDPYAEYLSALRRIGRRYVRPEWTEEAMLDA